MTSSSLCMTYRLNLRCGVLWIDIEVHVTCERGRSLIRMNEQSTPSFYGKDQRLILDLNDAHVYQSIYYIQLRSAKKPLRRPHKWLLSGPVQMKDQIVPQRISRQVHRDADVQRPPFRRLAYVRSVSKSEPSVVPCTSHLDASASVPKI
jgi:hypothetical protein